MPSYRGVYDHKTFGYIQLITNGFQSNVNHFKINCFQKTSEFINFAVFLFFFVQMLPSLIMDWFIAFLVKYRLFCLVSALSDTFLTLLISLFFFLNWRWVLDVIKVCCYCCLILLFVLVCLLNIC